MTEFNERSFSGERITLHDGRFTFEMFPEGQARVIKDDRNIADIIGDVVRQPLGGWDWAKLDAPVRYWQFVPKRGIPLPLPHMQRDMDPFLMLQEWVLGITAVLMDRFTDEEKDGIRNAVKSRVEDWNISDLDTARTREEQHIDLLTRWFEAFGIDLGEEVKS